MINNITHNKIDLSKYIFLFAHGAGADKNAEWMIRMNGLLVELGLDVLRFNFPYMDKRAEDGKRYPPDRQPKLLQCFAQQIEQLATNKKIIIGGKSMGGRMASLLMFDELVPESIKSKVAGIICLGFPFHPPKKPEKYRGEHLAIMKTPTLILQGERDPFGGKSEIENFPLSKAISLKIIPDGDHNFKPRVKSGFNLESNLQLSVEHIVEFVSGI